MLQHAREIAPSVSWDIIVQVKRTGGISVNELASLLKMSYMGVKQHCDDLKRRGYVDTWRRPKATGRPEKIFRPTAKLDQVFPNWGNELCLDVFSLLAQVHGENAPERFLYSFLQQKSERWRAKMNATSIKERVYDLVKLRNSDGWMSEVIEDGNQLRIIEHHSPLGTIGKAYPNLWEMEIRVLERCLNTNVDRQESRDGKSEFTIQYKSEPESDSAESPSDER